jgi:hypothetical protein
MRSPARECDGTVGLGSGEDLLRFLGPLDSACIGRFQALQAKRARSPGSTHHAIDRRRIEEWRDRWDILGIFE